MIINPIASHPNGVMKLNGSWETAFDVVDYPVKIVPLLYKGEADELHPAVGDTNTGRDTEFFGVLVDRNRTGQAGIIATVTGRYGSLPTKEVYQNLKIDIEKSGMIGVPRNVYVSGNGGRSILTVAISSDPADVIEVGGDRLVTSFTLDTSVDGSTRHAMRLVVVDDEGVELVGFGDRSFSVGTRHTRTIADRHESFQHILISLATEWNQNIAPMLMLMNDCKFDRTAALDFFETILSTAEVPERHIKNALSSYSPDGEQSVYSVLKGVSSYLSDALKEKPERLEDLRARINKKSAKVIKQTLEKFKNS